LKEDEKGAGGKRIVVRFDVDGDGTREGYNGQLDRRAADKTVQGVHARKWQRAATLETA